MGRTGTGALWIGAGRLLRLVPTRAGEFWSSHTAPLLWAVGALIALGTVMVFSVISARATALEVGVRYLLKHVLWVGIGIAASVTMSRLDHRRLERHSKFIAAAGLILLCLVLVPGLGTMRHGARRWFRLGPVGFQPSEFAKLSMLVGLCALAVKKDLRDMRRGFFPCVGMVSVTSALVLAEPDLGTAALIQALGISVVLSAGAPVMPIACGAIAATGGMSLFLWRSPARLARVMAFLDPWKYRQGAGYQVIHSLIALGSGGIFGRGLGAGGQKLFFLPESDTDFIFAVIGEELGLAGTLVVLLLFAVIIRQGMRISAAAPDAFGSLLAFGITVMIGLQGVIHVAVVTGCVPTKGLALPFVSSGGSSLVMNMAAVGILMSIARGSGRDLEEELS